MQRPIFLIYLLTIIFFNFGFDANAQNAKDDQQKATGLRIATFDVNATPPVGSSLTYDPMVNSADISLRARGIVLLGAGKPVVLCAIDWIGIANESQDVFKAVFAEAAGTIPERVAVHTVHQHDAPICDFMAERILKENNIEPGCFDGTFARGLLEDMKEAIQNAIQEAQPVTDYGTGKAPVDKVASNRRVNKVDGKIVSMRGSSCLDSALRAMPEGVIDPDVSLLSFWNNDKPLAVLSFYAVHPQSYYLTKIANPDFPGIARFMRELEVPDALHIHFSGAGGNVAAGKYNDGSHINRLILAERLADGMKRAWENTKKFKINPETIQWDTEPLFLPYNPKVAEIKNSMLKMNGRQLANNMGRLGWYKRRLEGKGIVASCLAVGEARLLFMPGEMFVEYQLAAQSMAPGKFVAMAAYGDYGPFYIGTKEAYHEGGYEIESSPVTEEAEEVLMKTIHKLLEKPDNCASLLESRDKKGNCSEIHSLKKWESRKKEILKNMQKVMGKLPSKYPHKFDLKFTDSLKQELYVRYSINFQVAPKERVTAYLYKPLGESGKYPAMVALHSTGSGGKRITDDEENIRNRGYAKELAERGYVVIAPDYPGFGEQTDYDFENDRYDSGTMKGIFNHISCVNLLQSLQYVNKERIGVIGHSLGGHNAIFTAAFDPRIKVVVSSCGWTLMDYYHAGERAANRYGGRLGPWAQDRYMPYVRTRYNLDSELLPFDFDEVIAAIAPRPFFSNSPLFDANFSIEGVRLGAGNISGVYDFLNASDNFKVVHPSCRHDFPEEIRQEAYQFIDKYLKRE